MKCPFCFSADSEVKDSRPSDDGAAIRRRRSCANCGGRFTTFERVFMRDIIVIKKSGERELFEREKLARSLNMATRKRKISPARIDEIINAITRQLEISGENEVTSESIGELVMNALNQVDKVAFVRYASVYRNFNEFKDFEDFIKTHNVD